MKCHAAVSCEHSARNCRVMKRHKKRGISTLAGRPAASQGIFYSVALVPHPINAFLSDAQQSVPSPYCPSLTIVGSTEGGNRV
jgi:hypothetical protein